VDQIGRLYNKVRKYYRGYCPVDEKHKCKPLISLKEIRWFCISCWKTVHIDKLDVE